MQKNINIEKISFKVVQLKFVLLIKNYIGTWSLLNILMIFGIKEKLIMQLAIATNIYVRLMTAFVVQVHI